MSVQQRQFILRPLTTLSMLILGLAGFGMAPAVHAGEADISAQFQQPDCDSVSVESSKDLSNVILLFSDGSWEKFDDLDMGQTGDFAGTGDNAGKEIVTAYVKSGSKKSKADGIGGYVGVEFTANCSDVPQVS